LYFFSGAPVLRTAGEEFDAISMDGIVALNCGGDGRDGIAVRRLVHPAYWRKSCEGMPVGKREEVVGVSTVWLRA